MTNFKTKVIKSDQELSEAIKVIDNLLNKNKLSPEEKEHLDLMVVLVADYEENQEEQIPDICGVELLVQLAIDSGATFSQILEVFPDLQDFEDVISRNRNMNWSEMKAAGDLFKINTQCFLPQ